MQRFSAVTEEKPDLTRRAFFVWQRCAPALLRRKVFRPDRLDHLTS
jgi:hypothetical protein